jgi:hypothetical protein
MSILKSSTVASLERWSSFLGDVLIEDVCPKVADVVRSIFTRREKEAQPAVIRADSGVIIDRNCWVGMKKSLRGCGTKKEWVEFCIQHLKDHCVSEIPAPRHVEYRGSNGEKVGNLVIPKSLYDLFVMYLFAQGELDFTEERACLESESQNLWKQLQSLPEGSPERALLNNKYWDIRKKAEYLKNPSLWFHCQEGKKVNKEVKKLLEKFSADEKVLRMNHIVEAKILDYLTSKELLETGLSWDNMRDTAVDLMSKIALRGTELSKEELASKRGVLRSFWSEQNLILRPSEWMSILLSIRHEYDAEPGTYSLYRGGLLTDDDIEKEGEIHSLSFGQSVLTGVGCDYLDGSPLGFISNDFYAVDISEAEKNPVFYVPKLRGIIRFFEKGEIAHARSRFFEEGKTSGIYGAGVRSAVFSDILASRFFRTQEEYLDTARAYLKARRVVLLQHKN